MTKTNALRFLDSNKIKYQTHEYETNNQHLDALTIASILDQDPYMIFKTLTCISNSNKIYVFVIPGPYELDLKKAAALVQEKSIQLLPLAKLLETTGYVRGGCSPIKMKKNYPTYIHESCLNYPKIFLSAGKVGLQVELAVTDLLNVTKIKTANLIKEEE